MGPKVNKYRCERCEGEIVTVERVEGVTPMYLRCRATDGCGGGMVSAMYRLSPEELHDSVALWEWVKPAPGSALWKQAPEHCRAGGLMLQKIAEGGKPVASPLSRVKGWRKGVR